MFAPMCGHTTASLSIEVLHSWDPGRIAGRVDRVEEAFNVD